MLCGCVSIVRYIELWIYGQIPLQRIALKEINKCGSYARQRFKKSRLTERHKSLKLAFAKKYQKWTMDDWEKVIWTDESKINLFGSDEPKYVYKKSNAALTDRDVIPTMKFDGGILLFFGMFLCARTWKTS